MTKEEYKKNDFNDQSFLREITLKDKMNTATGKQIAQERHRYMEGFLAQFYAEWEGEIGCW
jgi:uncharacterized protein